MLRGQVAIFLSCSEKFKSALAWPVRDVLTGHGLCTIIVRDEPPLPGIRGDAEASAERYLDASSAFVALCTADYELSDGSKYPRASIVDEIHLACTRPHLRDRCQVLRSRDVLLPSDINPTYDCLDVAAPGVAADVILSQLRQWGVAPRPPGPPAAPRPVAADTADAGAPDAGAPDDANALVAGLLPDDHDEACRRVYRMLRDRSADRCQGIVRELHGELMESDDHARKLAAVSLLGAASRLDPALVSIEMVEALATHPGYLARSCAANVLRDRTTVAPGDVPVGMLGRLASPSMEDWFVWAPAMAAVQELVLYRRDAYVIFESLAASADLHDRDAVAQALLDVAEVKPAAVARDLAECLASDPDPLIAAKAQQVVAAIGHVTDRDHADCYRRFGPLTSVGPPDTDADPALAEVS
jgi:hypothetical protein